MNPDVVTFLLILLVNFVITFLYWLFFFVIQKSTKRALPPDVW